MILALWPLVWLSQQLTRLLSRREAAGGHGSATVHREELQALARLGHEQGQLDESESRILTNLFRFSALQAHDIMTPRTVLRTLEADMTLAEVVEGEQLPFTRVPVIRESLDDIEGYVLRTELLLDAARGEEHRRVADYIRPIMAVPATLPVASLFSRLLDRREQIALLVDEFGGTEGVATMEDVVETLIGIEIMDEVDTIEDLRSAARQRWRRRAAELGIVEKE
jgi:CBS domain containing-hemolysin-like protein